MVRKQPSPTLFYTGLLVLATATCTNDDPSNDERVLNAPQGLRITPKSTSAVSDWISDENV